MRSKAIALFIISLMFLEIVSVSAALTLPSSTTKQIISQSTVSGQQNQLQQQASGILSQEAPKSAEKTDMTCSKNVIVARSVKKSGKIVQADLVGGKYYTSCLLNGHIIVFPENSKIYYKNSVITSYSEKFIYDNIQITNQNLNIPLMISGTKLRGNLMNLGCDESISEHVTQVSNDIVEVDLKYCKENDALAALKKQYDDFKKTVDPDTVRGKEELRRKAAEIYSKDSKLQEMILRQKSVWDALSKIDKKTSPEMYYSKRNEIIFLEIEIAKRKNRMTGENDPALITEMILQKTNELYTLTKSQNYLDKQLGKLPLVGGILNGNRMNNLQKEITELNQKWEDEFYKKVMQGETSLYRFNPNTDDWDTVTSLNIAKEVAAYDYLARKGIEASMIVISGGVGSLASGALVKVGVNTALSEGANAVLFHTSSNVINYFSENYVFGRDVSLSDMGWGVGDFASTYITLQFFGSVGRLNKGLTQSLTKSLSPGKALIVESTTGLVSGTAAFSALDIADAYSRGDINSLQELSTYSADSLENSLMLTAALSIPGVFGRTKQIELERRSADMDSIIKKIIENGKELSEISVNSKEYSEKLAELSKDRNKLIDLREAEIDQKARDDPQNIKEYQAAIDRLESRRKSSDIIDQRAQDAREISRKTGLDKMSERDVLDYFPEETTPERMRIEVELQEILANKDKILNPLASNTEKNLEQKKTALEGVEEQQDASRKFRDLADRSPVMDEKKSSETFGSNELLRQVDEAVGPVRVRALRDQENLPREKRTIIPDTQRKIREIIRNNILDGDVPLSTGQKLIVSSFLGTESPKSESVVKIKNYLGSIRDPNVRAEETAKMISMTNELDKASRSAANSLAQNYLKPRNTMIYKAANYVRLMIGIALMKLKLRPSLSTPSVEDPAHAFSNTISPMSLLAELVRTTLLQEAPSIKESVPKSPRNEPSLTQDMIALEKFSKEATYFKTNEVVDGSYREKPVMYLDPETLSQNNLPAEGLEGSGITWMKWYAFIDPAGKTHVTFLTGKTGHDAAVSQLAGLATVTDPVTGLTEIGDVNALKRVLAGEMQFKNGVLFGMDTNSRRITSRQIANGIKFSPQQVSEVLDEVFRRISPSVAGEMGSKNVKVTSGLTQ